MEIRHIFTLSFILLGFAAIGNAQEIAADKTYNFCKNTGDYVDYNTAISVPAGKVIDVITSRYSYWTSTVSGTGTLNIRSGGERCYLGSAKGATFPTWTSFKGDAHLYPYKNVVSSAGFYGLIWGHGGKTFNPEEPEKSISEGKVNNCFAASSLTMHNGTALASESGNRGIRIGHLEMEEGSRLYSYFKNSNTPKSYYVIGASNKDATLAGRISPMDDNLQNCLGIIKEGKGTYRITGNTNNISGALRVLDGRVLFNNDYKKALSSRLTGSTGTPYKNTDTGVFVMKNGVIGGTGSVAAVTDVYGTIEPGDDGIGTLTFRNCVSSAATTLRVRPTTNMVLEIASSESADMIDVNGMIEYYNITQDFATSTKMPTINVVLREGASLKVGDSFSILKYKSLGALNNVEWNWNIKFPDTYTWEYEVQTSASGAKELVVKVVSLEADNGEGGGNIDNNPDDEDSWDAGTWDLTTEKRYTAALSTYSNYVKKNIGVAVRGWVMDINNDYDTQTALIAKQFNAVVAENEMKFDATEPSQNQFSYGGGDNLVNFARRNNKYVRGHCLAWHSQVPGWLTSDGTKNSMNRTRTELLSILKNHIFNLVGRWKGKVSEWDVCNEVLDDNQTDIRTNPNAYTLRPSVWKTGIGEDYIDSAFVWAHQADPNAILILNDYDVEFKGQAKTEALYNLARRLKNSGIPIHGVGLQCHLNAGNVDAAKLRANMMRYAELGLVCNITELDLGISDTSEASLQLQANDYYAITKVFLDVENSNCMMIWGLRDNDSWRSSNPLLYNSSLTAKPAYWGVHAALRQTYDETRTGVEDITNTGVEDNKYYDLTGRIVSSPKHGIFIHKGKKILIK